MMSTIPGPPLVPRFPAWQHHAIISSGVTTGTATPLVPSCPFYPLPGPSPLSFPHLPPPIAPHCLRVPIPFPQFPFHTPHNRHHLHFAPPSPAASSTTASPQSTPCIGASSPTVTTAPGALHLGLPVPADLRRPVPLVYGFTRADLDHVLYGYVQGATESPTGLKYALSGLRIFENDRGRKTFSSLPPSCDDSDDVKKKADQTDPERAHSLPDREKPASQSQLNVRTVKLPEGISITQTMVGGFPHYSVFCHTALIPKATRFGPFTGRIIHPSEIKRTHDTNFMWEIFHEGKLSHFVDGRNGPSNWLCFVNCARHAEEQNLVAVQNGELIYYESCKDILRGAELLVWYGDSYRQFMGIPVSLKGTPCETRQDEASILQKQEGYKCDRCGKVFSYEDYRDKHLKYTRCVDRGDRKFRCHLCTRSFEKRDRLRIHILHVHQKHRPHKCSVCGKSFSQSSSLNKHMRVHSGERPYKCVYCSKAFTASSILRTHIRQHSGEKPFKCKHCGKAFASHAAHDSHVRRTHGKEKTCVCTVCGKSFSQNYELEFHMNIHPGENLFNCKECGRQFDTAVARDYHVTIHALKGVDTTLRDLNIQTAP